MSGIGADSSPQTPGGETPGDGANGQERERSGPLVLERLRKDDGRALILYSSSAVPTGE